MTLLFAVIGVALLLLTVLTFHFCHVLMTDWRLFRVVDWGAATGLALAVLFGIAVGVAFRFLEL